ncbi:hypothetical protein RBQ61_02580 [Sedimentibacter sp. MB35-C1]|uniref:hypothetical protein n=1 Tax=Sedimentibacter sp. MB35-C1 TaxID=3070995 RepID=UPI0027E040F2|nr:hypothetical protein [Sedimentibacter sp. MB35-C1]WMJ77832.1 hypothetical protein RBQ61_02580 [Sedimentibacter sp. MB35-C1]
MSLSKQDFSCKNVFKNSSEHQIKQEFNQKVIELINEKNKTNVIYKRDLQIISH